MSVHGQPNRPIANQITPSQITPYQTGSNETGSQPTYSYVVHPEPSLPLHTLLGLTNLKGAKLVRGGICGAGFFWAVVMGVALTSGCGWEQARQSQMIARVLQAAEEKHRQRLQDPQFRNLFQDVTFREDPQGSGVLFEYTFAENAIIDERQFQSEAIRREFFDQMAGQPTERRELEQVFRSGIYFKFIYRRHNGEVISETRIDQSHLN